MAVPFEQIVLEDLNVGIGTVQVTMPAGGSAAGTKLGLHTWSGAVYNVKSLGAGLGGADDTQYFNQIINLLAGASGVLYLPTGTYNIATNLSIPSNVLVRFAPGAILSPTTGKTLTIAGPMEAPLAQIFSGAGTVSITGPVEFLSPHWWGALADDSHDDTTAIQAALDASITTKVPVHLIDGTYKISSQLKLYKSSAPAASSEGTALIGKGDLRTIIKWYGSSASSPIRVISGHPLLARFQVLQGNGLGWLAGIDYDGDATIGRSTHGFISHVMVDGNSLPGDGIALGRTAFQADMLKCDHCYVQNLPYGSAFITLNGNALSTVLIAPTVVRCLIGVTQGQTTNFSVFGGEFDDNGINFIHGLGDPMYVSGIRTEGCKRMFWNNTSSAGSQVTFQSITIASADATRPAAQGAIQSGTTTLTISQAAGIGFVSGDQITIAGAGPAAADLNTTIQGILSAAVGTVVVQVANAASTTVTTAAVTLTVGVTPTLFSENGAGPYVHINVFVNTSNVYRWSVANGVQAFIGCRWDAVDIIDPFGSVVGTLVFQVGNLVVFSCTSNGNTRKMRANTGESIITAFAAGDATPSVAENTQFVTANVGATTITAFDDGYNGQRIHVLVNDAFTSIGGGSIKTSTGAAVAAVNGRLYTFVRFGGLWYSTGL